MILMGLKMKESDMFLPIKQYLEEEGYMVYAEVPCYGKTADIVAVKGKLVTVIETKLTMNIKLLEQVFEWRHKAHYIYAAVPQKTRISLLVRKLLIDYGIGIIYLDIDTTSDRPYCSRVYKYSPARLFRKIGAETYNGFRPLLWEQHIIPEHSLNISGVRHADIRMSRYKLMMRHVKRLLTPKEEGMSIDELANTLDTYYSNPKIGLYNALKKHESDWCEIFKKPGDRKTYVRLKTD
ncbi:hypothetical protein Dtox_2444 [Desulfofarcimen acetoxidans DSM 771]|uniref:Uncharacterized protein n=1 Tax=Desulfofarcimen acetoxidans (strain ATCC 49208 / DSM 771 / KCTC 5769 / VKM B-1644 / 5575) TaxID=485916 RepID=C8W0J8_DESAS|nr:hypothetical protein Dtox_2444 [Desulfofarcimen acetoxidans DSM 771]